MNSCHGFDTASLLNYERMKRDAVLNALQDAPFLIHPEIRDVQVGALEGVYGAFHDNHAFRAFYPDWGIRLLERQATEGLAFLLRQGTGMSRARRVRAFLDALRVPDLPADEMIERATVVAEENRVDLTVKIPEPDNEPERVVLVEAKFGAPVTPEQLNRYFRAYKGHRRCCRLLVLNPNAGNALKKPLRNRWTTVLWRDFWLRFEKTRPPEADGQLAAFQAWLWQRVGSP